MILKSGKHTFTVTNTQFVDKDGNTVHVANAQHISLAPMDIRHEPNAVYRMVNGASEPFITFTIRGDQAVRFIRWLDPHSIENRYALLTRRYRGKN